MTFSITTFGIMKLSIKSLYVTLSIKLLCVTLSITMVCHYAECCVLPIVMLNVVMLSVVAPKELNAYK